jgi:hypothetical protein
MQKIFCTKVSLRCRPDNGLVPEAWPLKEIVKFLKHFLQLWTDVQIVRVFNLNLIAVPNDFGGDEQHFQSRHMDGVAAKGGRLFRLGKRLQMPPQATPVGL